MTKPTQDQHPNISNFRQSISDHHNDIFFAAVSKTRMPMIVTNPREPNNPIIFASYVALLRVGVWSLWTITTRRDCCATDRVAIIPRSRLGVLKSESASIRRDEASYLGAYLGATGARRQQLLSQLTLVNQMSHHSRECNRPVCTSPCERVDDMQRSLAGAAYAREIALASGQG